MADQPYQSLYRRFRPERFAEVLGQMHVTTALRNAVANERVAHAYLFSGPRGTGKTSTARILAAALNCAAPVGGEPDTTCASCVSVRAGTSFDVVELDAASNNGVDSMRDLVARAALGSPGRWKVYIVDEVHMLSTAASNALLKTLEEPPGHVVFVLATTDPQKVLPTIRSRTQHFEFHLLGSEVLTGLLADVNARADLGLDSDTIDVVARRGNGSARDALSSLDQAAALGGAEDELTSITSVVEAMIARDGGAALIAVAEAMERGRDPQRLAIEIVEHLRTAFLLTMAPQLAGVPESMRAGLADQAKRLGPPATVRAMEVLGETLVAIRDSLDTRVTLELALVRLCAPAADTSPAALLERLESLERRMSGGAEISRGQSPGAAAPRTGTGPRAEAPAPRTGTTAPPRADAGAPPQMEPTAPTRMPQDGPRATIGSMRNRGPTTPAPAAAPSPSAAPAAPAAPPARGVDRDELTKVWGDRLFGAASPAVKSLFRNGRWVSVEGGVATFVVPNEMFRVRADEKRGEVETALAAHFGTRIAVRVEADGGDASMPAAPRDALPAPRDEPAPDEDHVSAAEFAAMEPAPEGAPTAEARLLDAFPGTEEVTG